MKEAEPRLSPNQERVMALLDEIQSSLGGADIQELVQFDRKINQVGPEISDEELTGEIAERVVDTAAQINQACSEKYNINLKDLGEIEKNKLVEDWVAAQIDLEGGRPDPETTNKLLAMVDKEMAESPSPSRKLVELQLKLGKMFLAHNGLDEAEKGKVGETKAEPNPTAEITREDVESVFQDAPSEVGTVRMGRADIMDWGRGGPLDPKRKQDERERQEEETRERERQKESDARIEQKPEEQTETEKMPDWKEGLSEGQQRLTLENLKQLRLGLAQERATKKGQEALKGGNVLARAWVGMTYALRKGKLAKEALEEVQADTVTGKKLLLEIAEGIKGAGIDAREGKDGKLEILFAENFKRLLPPSIENAARIDTLNNAANAFSKIPYEWSLETASGSQRRQYQRAHQEYLAALAATKTLLSKNGYRDLNPRLDGINQRVLSQRLINNHPEIDRELAKIRSPKLWRELAFSGGYFGLGYVRRSLVAQALGTFGANFGGPAVAALVGGWRARNKAKENLRASKIESRRGGAGRAEIQKTTKAEGLAAGLKRLADTIDSQLAESGKVDPEKLRNIIASAENAQRMLEQGLIDFGPPETRLKAQYALLEVMARAKAAGAITDLRPSAELSDKMKGVAARRREKARQAQKKFVEKQFIKGVVWGGGLAVIGRAASWYWHHAEAPTTPGSHQPEHLAQPGRGGLKPSPLAPRTATPETAHAAEVPPAQVEPIKSAAHEATIKESGNIWKAARSLVGNKKEFERAWANPESQVKLANGDCLDIHNLNLVHAGDKLIYLEGKGEHAGHFEFSPSSGKTYGMGEHLPWTERHAHHVVDAH